MHLANLNAKQTPTGNSSTPLLPNSVHPYDHYMVSTTLIFK